MTFGDFQVGRVYIRKDDIHGRYSGQRQGGISTPADHQVIFLFTSDAGGRHGYKDGWDTGVFCFYGEGQKGDMKWQAGNRAVRDHVRDGKELLLFKSIPRRQGVCFEGVFQCAGHREVRDVDTTGVQRQAFVFHLINAVDLVDLPEQNVVASEVSLDDLRRRAFDAARPPSGGIPKDARRNYYERSAAVRCYVLARSAGVCEGCQRAAPFQTLTAFPYLEPHHIMRLSDGGPDDPRQMAALCPNCHREVHHGADGKILNKRVQTYVVEREAALTAKPSAHS